MLCTGAYARGTCPAAARPSHWCGGKPAGEPTHWWAARRGLMVARAEPGVLVVEQGSTA